MIYVFNMDEIPNFNHLFSNARNVQDILGFFHHQLSQQAKDIAILNRRVAELLQNSKISDQATVSSLIETSHSRLDSYGASIKSLTDQIIQLQNVTAHNLTAFKNNIRNEIKSDIDQITSEIGNIKNYIKINETSLPDHTENNSSPEKSTKGKNQKKKKSNISKPKKINKNHINTISIIDISPKSNNSYDSHNNNNHHQANNKNKNAKNLIETNNNSKNVESSKVTNENENNWNHLTIQEKDYEEINKRIHEKIEEKFIYLEQNEKMQNNKVEKDLLVYKNEIDLIKNDIIDNENKANEKFDALNRRFDELSIKIENHKPDCVNDSFDSNNHKNAVLSSTDSMELLFDSKQRTLSAHANSINPNPSISSDLSGSLMTDFKKSDNSRQIRKNASPRKTSTHFTLINGDYLKRPGTHMSSKPAYKAVKPYPV
ncbi:hypothetical protein TRFO_16293 [Tritrichomonas foetus]|uniref:Uncharacterized protein n=1 Tax=Tritrichomonas foetus TaxID=1144522 RepID=A0A1J4KVA9_9EUKA|nr:hypothetical protein TRFO_16293 [Tritrichomonas foetus]|eukprot:OHT13445.1 hypothetical protein TRFO_16293 [Tritrichomonas foetus]